MASALASRADVLIRCDASAEIGYGHVVRCLAVAESLRDEHQTRVRFAMAHDPESGRRVASRGFEVIQPPAGHGGATGQWLASVVGQTRPGAVLLDIREPTSPADIHAVKEAGAVVATLDDPTETRLLSDLAFYPPVPQVRAMDWSGYGGHLHIGWEWVVVRPDFAEAARHRPADSTRRRSLLIMMGGSDRAGFTLRSVAALDGGDEEFDGTIVIGPAFSQTEELTRLLRSAKRRYTVERDPPDLVRLMAESGIALIAFGMTAYELAVLGVPSVAMSLTEDHAQSASAMHDLGMIRSLGVLNPQSDDRIAKNVDALLRDETARQRMAETARRVMDGRGASRVADALARSTREDEYFSHEP